MMSLKRILISSSSVLLLILAVISGLMVMPGPHAVGQTIYGSISGTVTDQSGAVVPDVAVKITNDETGITRETKTNNVGFYRVTSLPIGRYSVSVTAPNFDTVITKGVDVAVSVERTVDVTIKPKSIQETVTVTTEETLIETTKSQLSKGVEERRIMELPGLNSLNGLALLQPGTTPNNNSRPGSGFTVNGGRTRSNNFTIDGSNNNDQSLSIARQNLPPTAIQEFRLITNNFSAEYGRNSGSIVNVITRSGTNELHGVVAWSWLGNSFDALTNSQQRTFNSSKALGFTDQQALRRSRSVTVDNLGTVSAGGPIKKDHTFFFTSYDREWFHQTTNPTPTIALSPQGLAALQAVNSQFAPGALDILINTFPTANDPTPRGQLNIKMPNGTVIPVPLQQFNRGLTGAFPFSNPFWRFLQKIDSKITSKDNFSARFLIDNSFNPGAATAIPGQEEGQVVRNLSMTINEIHILNPSTVNEFRFTYSRRNISFPENLGAALTITGFNAVGDINMPQFRKDNVYEYTDNFSHMFGRHQIKAGINLLRYQLNSFFAPNLRGQIIYPSLGEYLFDQNGNFSQYAGDGYVPSRTTELGAFFQDEFRLRPNFTLNLGVRYEYTGAPFGYFSNAQPDINNWAPRFGFAWTPHFDNGFLKRLVGSDRTVVRGGYAISYDQVFQNILLNDSRNFPRGVNVAIGPVNGQRFYDPAHRPAPPTPEDYVKQGNDPNLLPIRLYSPNKRISQPYGQQFSLGIERQFAGDFVFKLYYVGSRGVKLVREVERNIGFTAAAVNANPSIYSSILPALTPVKNSSGVITKYITDPTHGSTLIGDGMSASTYHSMQLTVEKRFSHGLQFQANYTWSSFISLSDDILGGAANRTLPSVPFNLDLDRARSAFDQPHRFVLNYVYQIPGAMKDTKVLNRILGGWEISGITTFASGIPFTVFNSSNALGILPGQISTITDSQRPTINLNGTFPLPTSTGVSNPYFVLNPTNSGRIGTAGANIMRTGGTNTWNAALVKNTKTFGERQSLQIRWEVFNVFSHRNFTTIPTSTVTSTTDTFRFLNLGQTSGIAGRSMLFTLRYMF